MNVFHARLETFGETHGTWVDGYDGCEALPAAVEEQGGDVAVGIVGDALIAANGEEAGQWEVWSECFQELPEVIREWDPSKEGLVSVSIACKVTHASL